MVGKKSTYLGKEIVKYITQKKKVKYIFIGKEYMYHGLMTTSGHVALCMRSDQLSCCFDIETIFKNKI